MFVKIRVHYVFEEKFIFGSESALPGVKKGELPAKAGGILEIFRQISQLKQGTQTPSFILVLASISYFLKHDPRI